MNKEQIRLDLQIATGAVKPAAGDTMAAALARLDALAREADLPGDLVHYLSRRSYLKALAWLDNPDQPHRV